MNLFTRLTTTGVLLLAPAAFAANAFEGKVSMTMTSSRGESHALNYMMKGSTMRMDMEGAPASTIMDMGKRQMTILLHQQRMYMVRPMPEPQHQTQAGSEGSPSSPHDMPDVQSTGKTEKILGYTCNQFLIKDGDKTTEVWLAPDLGMFMGLNAGGSPFGGRGRGNPEVAAKWEQVFKGKAGFPLRVITREASGKESMRMEVTKIEKGGVSDSDFTPPGDYRPFQMPNIPGMNPFGGG